MTSDGRVWERPLRKASCRSCGYCFHTVTLGQAERERIYGTDYDLGQRDAEADATRAADYLEHIRSFLKENCLDVSRGGAVIELGCGSGALLNLMVAAFASRMATGVEPAPRLAAAARRNADPNVEIFDTFAESVGIHRAYDLAVSINVLEHALAPVAFLEAVRSAISPSGAAVIVCPDGDVPGSELLFQDHISSFSVHSLRSLAVQTGLELAATRPLGGRQSGFRIHLLRQAPAQRQMQAAHADSGLTARRDAYLAAWGDMESRTLAALGGKRYAIFGVGEYADLLEAYCPKLAAGALAHVVDRPVRHERGNRPILSLQRFLEAGDGAILLAAVHHRSWSTLKSRLDILRSEAVHPYQFTSLRSLL